MHRLNSYAMNKPARGSLLSIEQLEDKEILGLLKLARRMNPLKARPLLRNKRIMLLFYEASTRTRSSFEIAAKSMGAITTLVESSGSSIEKGESLLDTAYTLRAVGADAIVIRHPAAGAPHLMAKHLDIPVINAGDGMHEHPSQALLDMLTILDNRSRLDGLNVVIVGDIFHSRVARSNIWGLTKMGATVVVCGPATLIPPNIDAMGVQVSNHLEQCIPDADVIMVLRLQKERQHQMLLPSLREYATLYGINSERLKQAKKDVLIMHPGPMNRGVEISPEVADGPYSVILDQVTNGVAVRMALLYLLAQR